MHELEEKPQSSPSNPQPSKVTTNNNVARKKLGQSARRSSPTPSDKDKHSHKKSEEVIATPRQSVALSIILFFGAFLGSLLGVAADISEARDTVKQVIDYVNPPPASTLAGSNTILGDGIDLTGDWLAEFEAQTKWQIWHSVPIIGPIGRSFDIDSRPVGTVNGFELAAQGQANLLAASEPMSPERYEAITAQGVEIACAAEIGYDVITFVTYLGNTVPAVQTRELASILNGSITNWSEVGGEDRPIHILARRGSGTTEIVLDKLTGSPEYRDHFVECDSNGDCLDKALSLPGALYWVSASWLHTQPPRYLRLILVQRGSLAPENPLGENFAPNNYPPELIRPLYMFVLGGDNVDAEGTDIARDFFHFVRGRSGQKILESHLFFTYFDPPADVGRELPPGFGLGSDGVPVVCRSGFSD